MAGYTTVSIPKPLARELLKKHAEKKFRGINEAVLWVLRRDVGRAEPGSGE